MACALGARLARYGRAAVTLAGTWTAALEAIASRGIVVDEPGGVWSATVSVAPLAGPLGAADVVLVLVKSPRTTDVAHAAARSLLPGSLVVTLQTGLGNRELLEEACGPDQVAVGVASLTATLLGPGDPAPGVARFAELMAASRLDAEVSVGIERVLWARLAVTCALNLSALTGRTHGTLLETPEPCETLLKAAREVGALAQVKGIDLGGDPAILAVEAAESAAATRSGMSHDLERGARTEVDAQNGAVVLEGRRFDVPTPVNEYLWQRIREKERLSAG